MLALTPEDRLVKSLGGEVAEMQKIGRTRIALTGAHVTDFRFFKE